MLNLNVNISNLFDQQTITNFTNTPWRDRFTGFPAVPSNQNSDRYFFNGFDAPALAAAMRAAGATQLTDPRFGLPSAASHYQSRREIRLGLKYSF